jgi:hypothetical protein
MVTNFATNPNLRLFLEKDPDHIWAMTDGKGKIMLAFDSGDSGFVPLTIEQAQQVIESLQHVMKRQA